MPCSETIDAGEFALLFLEAIIRLHGVPGEILSNRDTCGVWDFWAAVSKRFQTKLLMSTVFHRQTDGLSEISNELVTRYLQPFTTHYQNQEDTMLPLMEYAYDTSTHSSTDRSRFKWDLRNTPSIPLNFMAGQQQHEEMRSLEGAVFIEQLQASLLDAQDHLHEAQDWQMAGENRRQRPRTLEVGDFVMSSNKDPPMTYPNQDPSRQKVQHPWAGRRKITRFHAANARKLKSPADMTIHNTVNVSSLEKCIAD